MIEIILDALLDTVKLIPFLCITYLIMEALEHRTSNKTKEMVKKSGKAGPVVGALLGMFPQCGFSVSATNLYAARVITIGTLISIYLSTSDEMIPIFISEAMPVSIIICVLAIKVATGMLAGTVIDFINERRTKKDEENIEDICEHEHCHCKEGSILKSAIHHTISISFFIFVITLVINGIITVIGEENIANLVLDKPILGPVVACLVGLIPNCAASVILAQLYIKDIISIATMIAGLLASSGIGLLVLFKINRHLKENIKIVVLLYSISVVTGILLEVALNFVV